MSDIAFSADEIGRRIQKREAIFYEKTSKNVSCFAGRFVTATDFTLPVAALTSASGIVSMETATATAITTARIRFNTDIFTCFLTKLTADSEFSTYNIHMMYANFLHELTM